MKDRKIYRRLTPCDEVFNILSKYVRLEPRGVEEVYVGDAVGRVLAENVYARVNVPPFTRSLMDGYAVISSDVAQAWEDRPVRLKVVASIPAGSRASVEIKPGECCEVATGAPLPFPADAVVPVEYTKREGDSVLVYRRVRRGEHVDTIGSDAVEGEVVAWKGTLVTPELVATIAASGVKRVKVYKRVRVHIIPTGNEIVELGNPLEYGKLYDSNSHMIYALLKSLGADVTVSAVVRDNFNEIKRAVDAALSENDVVVTIGGTSAGLEDLTYRVFESYSPGVVIHGLAVKPGRPTVIALSGEKLLIGLPGFPFSCLLIATIVLAPLIAKLQGLVFNPFRRRKAKLLAPVTGVVGLKSYTPGLLVEQSGELHVYPLPMHSGRIVTLTAMDCFIELSGEAEYLKSGSTVTVITRAGYEKSDLVIAGSHCPLLQSLIDQAKREYNIKVLWMGSTGGLNLMKHGAAHVAGVHLYDPSTGEYNIPYIKKMALKSVVLVRGYVREQGFVYRPDSCTSVSSFSDIIKLGLRFVNRNQGSGTRLLVDQLIEEEAEKLGIPSDELRQQIRGYNVEVRSHEAVAYMVAKGIADVGVATRYVAVKYGLRFTKIKDEIFDIAIRKETLDNPAVEKLLGLLEPSTLSSILVHYAGYRLHEKSGQVIYTT